MTLDSGNIRFMRICAVVLKIYVNFPDFMPVPLYYVRSKRHAVVVFNFKCLFMTVSYQYGCRGDVGHGVAEYDPQSIWNPRKTADLS